MTNCIMQLNMKHRRSRAIIKTVAIIALLTLAIYGISNVITWMFDSFLGGFTVIKYLTALFLLCVVVVYFEEVKKDRSTN